MKATWIAILFGLLLSGCAGIAELGSPAAGNLPAGRYRLTSMKNDGTKVAGPTVIDVPFNDPNVAMGGMCINTQADKITITNKAGSKVREVKCNRELVDR